MSHERHEAYLELHIENLPHLWSDIQQAQTRLCVLQSMMKLVAIPQGQRLGVCFNYPHQYVMDTI